MTLKLGVRKETRREREIKLQDTLDKAGETSPAEESGADAAGALRVLSPYLTCSPHCLQRVSLTLSFEVTWPVHSFILLLHIYVSL